MGLFGKIFSKGEELPSIDSSLPEFNTVKMYEKHLEKLSGSVDKSLEVLPCEDKAFVFIGNPPIQFGIAWVKDKYVFNLKGVAKEKGLKPAELQKISEDIRSSYEQNINNLKKYKMDIPNGTITVVASQSLGSDISKILSGLIE